ncbi:MAG: FIST N-terminal domain-containing protein [Nautiliaceae bacterium]
MKHYVLKGEEIDNFNKNFGENTLIQVFCGEGKERFKEISSKLRKKFPHAVLIGSSTDGEIYNKEILNNNTVISISEFDNTCVEGLYVNEENSFLNGVEIGKKFKDSKLLITFIEVFSNNAEDFLKGISGVKRNLLVAGGVAGDNGEFKKTYIMLNGEIYDKGAVGVGLFSDVLRVEKVYNFGWKGVGLEHIITKADKNRVYEIDNISAEKFYKKYLGDIDLPKIGVEFPLVFEKDGKKVARAMVGKHDDGSLMFGGDIEEGTIVKIGVGNAHTLLKEHELTFNIIPEGFYIYACMARRRFLKKLIKKEIIPFAKIAPSAGFFTYGEFFSFEKPYLFNETLTAIALSEKSENSKVRLKIEGKIDEEDNLRALWHFIDTVTEEYNQINVYLREKLKEIEQLKNQATIKLETISDSMKEGMVICDGDEKIIEVNKAFEKMIGLKRCEIIGKSVREFIDSDLDCKNFSNTQEVIIKGKKNIEAVISLNEMKLNKRNVILATIMDIGDLRDKERQIMQQSKLAQMGEMINMIAHQWRQPLNALSAIAIKMDMKNEMDMLSKEEIEKSASFIQKTVQNMSDTINSFLNFAKGNSIKDKFEINELLEDVLNMMKAQLDSHNIEIEINTEPIYFHSHKNEIVQILLNLISNARDVLDERKKENKKIKINIYKEDSYGVIEVEDNAGGIDEKIIDRIFEPYFTTKGPKGTGLGLYMSKMLATEKLKGDILVENGKEGAKFKLLIPLG